MAASSRIRYVVLGPRGMLGGAFLRRLGRDAVGVDRSQLELGDAGALERVLVPLRPDVLLNAAAYNNVDGAEAHHQAALDANARGPAQLAHLAARDGWRLVHFSTDYVYGDDGLERPRTEADPPAPLNFYGYSKLLGEQAVLRESPSALVLRVAHVYGGASLSPGRVSLVDRFIELARAGRPIQITRGQWLNPTSVDDIVQATLTLLERNHRGLFHCTGGGCTALNYVHEILRLAGLAAETRLQDADRRPARRSLNTVLENTRWRELGLPPLPGWRESLARYLSA